MIDIQLIRENPELVKENIKKKFQMQKIPLVDKVREKDILLRETQTKADLLKSKRNKLSEQIGVCMREKKISDADELKNQVSIMKNEIEGLEEKENLLREEIKTMMMQIPNIISKEVPIGEDDSKNVEEACFGDPIVPDYEIPYHSDIMASFNGLDKEAAGRVSGNGFYYLIGVIGVNS